MNLFDEIVEKVSRLSSDELEGIKLFVDKQLISKRVDELEQALIDARKKSENGLHQYYNNSKDLIASLNEE